MFHLPTYPQCLEHCQLINEVNKIIVELKKNEWPLWETTCRHGNTGNVSGSCSIDSLLSAMVPAAK